MTEEILRSLSPWIPILWLAALSCIVLLWLTLAIGLLLAHLRLPQDANRQTGVTSRNALSDTRPVRLSRPLPPTTQPHWHQHLPPQ